MEKKITFIVETFKFLIYPRVNKLTFIDIKNETDSLAFTIDRSLPLRGVKKISLINFHYLIHVSARSK